jgi:cysteine desulfurase
MKRIYLDWASSAPPLAVAIEAQKKISHTLFGNPSSLHLEGREARTCLEEARSNLARAADCAPEEVIFTNSATEANNMIASSVLKKFLLSPGEKANRRIVLSGIEHASLWEPLQVMQNMGFEIAVVPPEADGIVKPDRLSEYLNDKTVLVALMLVNNETGALQPVKECARLVKDQARRLGRKIHFHTDAVQAFGKLWFSFRDLGADSVSLSAHKLGGPRGAGALLVSRQAHLEYLALGGGQEHDRRPGTENTAGIAGFVQSALVRVDGIATNLAHAERLMAKLAGGIREIDGIRVIPAGRKNAGDGRFSPYILTVCIPPIPGEVLVRSLDDAGIALSTGSACHAGKKNYTRVLEAQGIPRATAECALRISLGPETEEYEIETLLSVLKDTIPLLQKISGKKR